MDAWLPFNNKMVCKKRPVDMSVPDQRKILPDPRSKAGPFETLFRDIINCKVKRTCPSLRIRQFYFEPNSRTLSFWKEIDFFSDSIDYRVMFICESPGPSAKANDTEDIEPCFYSSPRDHRFLDVRKKHGLADCYITNTVKCGVRQGGMHNLNEIEACKGFLIREINLIKPMILVGVGGNAYRTLRTRILEHLKPPPILFQITHYSSRRNPFDAWNKEFPELLRLLAHLRPRQEWTQ